ncbi:MAG: SRPBCC family protein [Myxococcota bacterium]
MSLLRRALVANAVFSATTGTLAVAAPGQVAGWLGAVAPTEITMIGLQLLAFAGVVGWVARRPRPAPAPVLIISAADLLWVGGTFVLLLFWPALFSPLGTALMLGVAGLVACFAAGQLAGLARQYRHPDPSSPHSHRVCLEFRAEATPAAMWQVVADLGAIDRFSPGLADARLLDGARPSLGAVRQCTDTAGQRWTETCTAWKPGEGFSVRFDAAAPDFPFPFTSMSGRWALSPTAGGTTVRVSWDLTPKPRRGGGLLVAAMAGSVARGMARVVAAMAAEARGEAAAAVTRRRPAATVC